MPPPPPTASDLTAPEATVGTATTEEPATAIERAVPMPDPDMPPPPPPTASDLTAPEATVGTATTEGPATAIEPPTASIPTAPAESARTEPTADTPAAESAATETPPPDPLASLDPADRPIAEKVRDLLPKSDRTFSNRKERLAVEAFYQSRNLAPLWFDKGVANARAQAVIARIQASAADGLVPTEYKLPNLAVESPEAGADAELRLSATLITFARHLQAGRFPYARMGGEIMFPQEPPDPAVVLGKIVDASDVAAAIDAFSPPHPGYRALKAKLAELRGTAVAPEEPPVVRIPEGALIRPDMQDRRVPLLRLRLKIKGDESDLRYDDELVAAVKAYQQGAGLNPGRYGRAGHGPQPQRRCACSAAHRCHRYDHRQHGALALAAARPRQRPCRAQHSRTTRCA